jgi:hypothetical protein
MEPMDVDPDWTRTPGWRDPLTVGWRAHRGILMLRLRWHERRDTGPAHRRPLSQLSQRLHVNRHP